MLENTQWNGQSVGNIRFPFHFLHSLKYGEQAGENDEALQEFEIVKWPPVLHIHLKRFGYDMKSNTSTKNNKQFEFFPQLDLSHYSDDAVYTLHSVLGELQFLIFSFLKRNSDMIRQ